jgi:hypothetical protein
MPALSRLGTQIEEIVSTLNAVGARFALIGGLALASHKVVRATSDVDLLTDAGTAEQIHQEMTRLGYSCLHRSAEVANYLRGDQRVDYLFASRPTARQLLEGAEDRITSFGTLRVISAEGLIAFKLQGVVNNPRRTQDLEDIKALLRANRETLNLNEVREYFRLFDREHLLDDLLNETR